MKFSRLYVQKLRSSVTVIMVLALMACACNFSTQSLTETPTSVAAFSPSPTVEPDTPTSVLPDTGAQATLTAPPSVEVDVEASALPSTQPQTPTLAPPTETAPPEAPSVDVLQNAFCRRGPGTIYDTVTAYVPGTELLIIGRNADASWLKVESETQVTCYISAILLQVDGNLDDVPVLPDPPPPTLTFTPSATFTQPVVTLTAPIVITAPVPP